MQRSIKFPLQNDRISFRFGESFPNHSLCFFKFGDLASFAFFLQVFICLVQLLLKTGWQTVESYRVPSKIIGKGEGRLPKNGDKREDGLLIFGIK